MTTVLFLLPLTLMTRVFAALACMGLVFSFMLSDMLRWRKRPSYVTETIQWDI
jgi:hypothetical protein